MSVVLHVPHAGTAIPPDVRRAILLDDAGLAGEVLASTDHHTDRFVAGLGGELDGSDRVRVWVNAYSRLVVDPERFLDPEREPTERVGRGAVYTRGFDGAVLRDVDDTAFEALRADLLDRFFAPHHAGIEQLVAGMLETNGACTIIDVHSYPRDAQPYELAGGLAPDAPRPALCIGTDGVHTPPELVALVEDVAASLDLATARDTPFAGTFVPTAWLGDARVRSVMLEIRRDIYMEESTAAADDAGVARLQALVLGVVEGVLAQA